MSRTNSPVDDLPSLLARFGAVRGISGPLWERLAVAMVAANEGRPLERAALIAVLRVELGLEVVAGGEVQ